MWVKDNLHLHHASVGLDLDTLDMVVNVCELHVMHSLTPGNDPHNVSLPVRTKLTLVHDVEGPAVVKLKLGEHSSIMKSR